MSALRASERRSLALLVDLAAEHRDGPRVLREGSARLPRAAREVAEGVAAAWERGEPGALAPALAPSDEAAAVRGEIERRALLPVLTASLALIASALGLSVGAPAVHALLVESEDLLGAAPPSRALSLLASHPGAVLIAGLAASLLLSLAPWVLVRLAATRRGSAILARLPIVRRLPAAQAAQSFALGFGARVRAGLPPHEAARDAAEACGGPHQPALRRCAERLLAGAPAAEAFDLPALGDLAGLRAASLGDPAGLADDVAARAGRRLVTTAARLGTAAALLATLLTATCAATLAAVVLVPLATLGGLSP